MAVLEFTFQHEVLMQLIKIIACLVSGWQLGCCV